MINGDSTWAPTPPRQPGLTSLKDMDVLKRLFPGGRPLDTTTDDCPALADRKSLAAFSMDLFRKLSQDSQEGAAAYARECGGILACLSTHGADGVSSFVLQGVMQYYEEGKELLACVRTALRVLGRLVQAGEDTPELRLGLGRPAVWCGVNLITGVRSHVPEWWGPDVERRLDFIAVIYERPSARLRLAPDWEPAQAGQAWWWRTCLLSARAELEVDLGIRAQLPVLPPIVLAALQAVRDAADACCGDNVEDELPFLLDASHIYKLSAAIVHEERLPKPQTEKLLRELDSMDAMIFNMFLLHRVLRFAFVAEPADVEEEEGELGEEEGEEEENEWEDEDGYSGCSSSAALPPEAIPFAKQHQAEALAALEGLLSSLRLSIANGGQLKRLEEEVDRLSGVGLLVSVFDAYYDEQHALGELQESAHTCLLIAADCLIAVLGGPFKKDALETFSAEGGYGRLLDALEMVSLGSMAEAYATSGRTDAWLVQCACLSVLEAAVTASEEGAFEFINVDGIPAALGAMRWDIELPFQHVMPLHIQSAAKSNGRLGSLEDMVRAVVAHALSVVGQACVACMEGGQLSVWIPIDEIDEYLQLLPPESDARVRDQPGQDCVQNKYRARYSLSSAVVLCAGMVLRDGREREALMRDLPGVLSLLLSEATTPGTPSTLLEQAAAFHGLSQLLRDRAVWRKQLLHEGAHRAAGAALVYALTLLKKEKDASLGHQIAQMRGYFTAFTCSSPACLMSAEGGCQGHLMEALEADRDATMGEAACLITSSAMLLLGLKKAGAAGRTAVLEVFDDGRLDAAASAADHAFFIPDFRRQLAINQLRELLAWGQELIRANGGKKVSVLQAEKAAEAAAAALLAEEEAAQRKAASKAAKRQRQKAAKQQAKQQAGRLEAEPPADEQQGASSTALTAPDSKAYKEPLSPAEATATALHCLGAPGELASGAEAPSTGASTAQAQGSVSHETPELGVQGNSERIEAGQEGKRQPLQPSLQPGSSQQASASRAAGQQAVKLKKPLKQKQQQRSAGAAELAALRPGAGSMEQPTVAALPAEPALLAGNEQTTPVSTIPVLGPATPLEPEAFNMATPTPAVNVPAPMTELATPADALSLTAESVQLAAPATEATMEAALEPQAPAGQPAVSAAGKPATKYEALLEYLLPGVVQSQLSLQARPPEASTSCPAELGHDVLPDTTSAPSSSGAMVFQQGPAVPASTLRAVLVCRLTGQRLADPVIAGDGHTYERERLTAWLLQGNSLSQATGKPLCTGAVRDNLAVRELLEGCCV